MDLPSLARDLDKLTTADAVVADSYVRYALRKGTLYGLAGILAVLGLAIIGLALYWLLEESLGRIGAAALVGVLGCLLASLVAVIAMLQRPGREYAVAQEMRRSAVSALEQNVGSPAMGPSAYIYPASEVLISSVLLPLMGSLIRNLKSPHAKTAETAVKLNDSAASNASQTEPRGP
ncbi:MAG: hypothetical protein JSR78_21040 [Proteobacteria bacterium]|nr:hypothetical protein [Pseudomonadota bacterium]